ncbi:electron transport complex subunit RsxC [Aliiglaciecola litoralis]|uniref:Ion-translocating oxidoreductase complex subunit C n=1 Tax=Aliiglaciecola litoralis TaxID=582857 RepID=A0ABN1LNM4_9ALTE
MYSQYDDIVARLNQDRLWDFPGGVHPPELKSMSNQQPIATIPMASKLYVTVKQHIGVEGSIVVKQGDRVLKGQALTKSTNPFAVPVHAPTSGVVSNISKHVSAHPSGIAELTIEISTDEFETWAPLSPILDYQQKPKTKIIEAICNAGISGMGGAGFPTHIKASPKKNVEFLIINGVECEPYITSDDRLMREHAWQIRQGIDVLVHLLSPKLVIIGIENNKPEAIQAMQLACQENAKYRVVAIPTKYPAGGEKQLIQVLTNREVPGNGLPIDVGVIMQNVGTCFAIADAIFSGKPLIQRVVTLTGEAFKRPQNVWAPIGTPISHLLEIGHYREHKQREPKLIMGGPMMGFEILDQAVPVVKITNCILAPAAHEVEASSTEQPCIRCSACADACPASLLPQQLFWHSKAKEYDKSQEYNLFDCIECGACAYVCPSEIPLVHYYRVAKADIRAQEHEKDQADKARLRFEARKERLEREQKEREEKHARAAEARKQAMSEKGNDAKDKIAAALARAKAKKQGQQSSASLVEESQQSQSTSELASTSAPSEKQDKVAAAIARAKAKREAAKAASQAQQPEQQSTTAPSVKQEKVAVAIAKAKAKREAIKKAQGEAQAPSPQATNTENSKIDADSASQASETEHSSATETVSAEQLKKQKIAQAVAKAKAKRQAAKQTSSDDAATPQTTTTDSVEPKVPASANKNSETTKQQVEKPAKRRSNAATTEDSAPAQSAAEIRKQKVEAAVAKAREKNLAAKAKRAQAKSKMAKQKPNNQDET